MTDNEETLARMSPGQRRLFDAVSVELPPDPSVTEECRESALFWVREALSSGLLAVPLLSSPALAVHTAAGTHRLELGVRVRLSPVPEDG